FTTPDNWRRIAHIISDAVYERLTGEKGYFDSRIVFVDETGPKDRRGKRLALLDQDGGRGRPLPRGGDPGVAPPPHTPPPEITHTSFRPGGPRRPLLDNRNRPGDTLRQ